MGTIVRKWAERLVSSEHLELGEGPGVRTRYGQLERISVTQDGAGVVGLDYKARNPLGLQGVTEVNRRTAGDINRFSRASQRTLLKRFLRYPKLVTAPDAQFRTLTQGRLFDNGHFDRAVKIYRQRLLRRYGSYCGVWIRELQTRGALHVHELASGLPGEEAEREWRRDVWIEVCGNQGSLGRDRRQYALDEEAPRGVESVQVYMAKVAASVSGEIGKRRSKEGFRGRRHGLINIDRLEAEFVGYYEVRDCDEMKSIERRCVSEVLGLMGEEFYGQKTVTISEMWATAIDGVIIGPDGRAVRFGTDKEGDVHEVWQGLGLVNTSTGEVLMTEEEGWRDVWE